MFSKCLVEVMYSLSRLLTLQRSIRFLGNCERQLWLNVIGTSPNFLRMSFDASPPHRYQAALRALYAKHGATAVFFEVGRVSSNAGHAHIQAVPVPSSLEHRVESAFREEGKLQGIEFDVEEAGASNNEEEGYFRVELPSGRKLVHRIKQGSPFSVQFGRYAAKSKSARLRDGSSTFLEKCWPHC